MAHEPRSASREAEPLLDLLLSSGCDVTACDKRTEEEMGEEAASLRAKGAKLKLGPDYLEDLAIGPHTLTAEFDDAEAAEASFTIVEADGTDNPKTGDTDPLIAWCVFVLSAAGLIAVQRNRKKRIR